MENNSPHNDILEQPRAGLKYQELITYEERNGILYKIVVSRKFQENDYVDSKIEIPLSW